MNISSTPEIESSVSQKVTRGLDHSAIEVIRDGLRLMKERDDLHQGKLAELRRGIAIGVDHPEQEQTRPFDEQTTARVESRGRKKAMAVDEPDAP